MNRNIFIAAVRRLLRPLMRVMLKNGISSEDFEVVARQVFVDVAEQDFALPNRKQSDSRISVLTGLSRKQVARLRKQTNISLGGADARQNRAHRVITGWLREFTDDTGAPIALPLEGKTSFDTLVKRFAGDVPSRAVADELLRIGNAVMLENGYLELVSRGYLPKPLSDDMLVLFGTHVADFLNTWDHNLSVKDGTTPMFQREVTYRYIHQDDVEEFNRLANKRGQNLLEELDRWLAARQQGRDKEDTLRLGLGLYQIQTPNEKDYEKDTE